MKKSKIRINKNKLKEAKRYFNIVKEENYKLSVKSLENLVNGIKLLHEAIVGVYFETTFECYDYYVTIEHDCDLIMYFMRKSYFEKIEGKEEINIELMSISVLLESYKKDEALNTDFGVIKIWFAPTNKTGDLVLRFLESEKYRKFMPLIINSLNKCINKLIKNNVTYLSPL